MPRWSSRTAISIASSPRPAIRLVSSTCRPRARRDGGVHRERRSADRAPRRRAQVVRRRRGAARHFVRRCQGPGDLHHRSVGVRQIDAAPLHQRADPDRARRDLRRSARGAPPCGRRADDRAAKGRVDRVPTVQPVPAQDSAAEHHDGARAGIEAAGRGSRAARARAAEEGAVVGQGGELSGRALGRPAAARGDRARARDATAGDAVRRSDGRARSRDAQGGAGDDPTADRGGHDVDPRHARDGIRARDRATRVLHRPRAYRRGRSARATLRVASQGAHARVPRAGALMKSHVQVAVIGGGVVGASVLYHLTRAGWNDVVLIERDELTSGSTWHAAGGMHTLNGDPNVAKLQEYTIKLYREIEEASGQSCGIHITAGVDLAATPERMDFLKVACARARYLGLGMEIISVDEAARLFPLMDKRHFVGALYNPLEGHVDPAGVTQAYAKAARNRGADVYRFTRVTALLPRADGSWDVITDKGNLVAEHVVNAGGLWAREVGRFVGLELPVLAMEHQYLITGEIPEVAASPTEMLHVIDFDGEIYMRQEGRGKRIVNGPFTFAPDGNPVVGPVRGLHNYWVACGVMAGFSQGGGVGLALANWMIDGDPGFDVWAMDVARFGDWATMAYTNAKVRENYSRRFRIRFPNEELTAARPLRTTPVYERLRAEHAVFGDYCGLEHALWF